MTHNEAKSIKKLHDKKGRKEVGLFIVEGAKSVLELLGSDFEVEKIYLTHSMMNEHRDALRSHEHLIELIDQGELAKISSLEFNDTGLAVVKQRQNVAFAIEPNDIILALDDIRDPGNLGTIIRTADWYGITKIVASSTTAELYNPKTISATMGSFTRVQVVYTELETFLSDTTLPVIGAYMDGNNAHTFPYPKSGILLMGNEANGVNPSLVPLVTDRVSIPRYGDAESLNVAMATGILLDNWKKSK